MLVVRDQGTPEDDWVLWIYPYVARAAPDGYTLGMPGSGSMAIGAAMYKQLPYDPTKDFAPIGIAAGTHAVYDVLVGSYSAGIIRKSKLPVLVVPARGN